MKITLESTTRVVEVNDRVPGRVWEGFTDTGIPVVVVITRIAVERTADQSQFERELQTCRPPSTAGVEAIPMRLIL